ncbi:MAG: hypothetical protein ACJAXV_001073 [Bacteroidia bacterium]|jgi:hypothetical protein
MKKVLIYTLFVLSLYSCETVLENVPVPEIPQKAVVFGSIEVENSYHTLRVTKSKPILNNSTSSGFDAIPDATVTVTSGAQIYTFTYSPAIELYEYRGMIDLSSGEAQLAVNTISLGSLTSRVIVPTKFGAYTLVVDSLVREYETEYAVQFTIPASDNAAYYRIDGYSTYATDTFSSYSTNEYHTNEDALDQELKVKTAFYEWDDKNGSSSNLYVRLSRISEEYYTYGKALENYEPNNPFAEPIPLPNNVEGGLGIFGISRSRVIKIR